MPLIEGLTITPVEKSGASRLIVSEGFTPAEQWLLDPTLPILFSYSFGWPAMRQVVIPKGCAVAVGPSAVCFDTGKRRTTLRPANGANPYVGLAPYNLCKKVNDRFLGNEPAIVRGMYVELPYIRSGADAALVKYGCVYGNIQAGDFLTPSDDSDNMGKCMKWDISKHTVTQMVGQVLAVEDDQEPFGWYKWVMWDETARKQDNVTPEFTQGAQPGDWGYPYDPAYRDGFIGVYTDGGYHSQYTLTPKGLRALTDGAQRATTLLEKTAVVPGGTPAGAKFVVDLGYRHIQANSVNIVLGAGLFEDSLELDERNGTVTLTVKDLVAEPAQMKLTFKAHFYGTPPGWDFRGAVGVVRLILR